VAAGTQGMLSPSVASGGPVSAADEQRHKGSTLTSVEETVLNIFSESQFGGEVTFQTRRKDNC